MSVSGWETRSTTSTMSMNERRARLVQQAPPDDNQQWNGSSSRMREGDVPSRHQAFPVQQAPHNGHQVHRPHDEPPRRQSQLPSPPLPFDARVTNSQTGIDPRYPHQQHYDPRMANSQPRIDPRSLQQSGYHEQVPYYEQIDANQRQLGSSRVAPSPQQQTRKQYNPTNEHQSYIEPHQPRQNGHNSPPRDEYADYRMLHQQQHNNGHEPPYTYQNQTHHDQPVEDEFYDTLPPPLPVRRGPDPATIPVEMPDHPVRQSPATSATSSADEEPPNIDDLLLGKRWSVHVISHMYQFQRQELGDYAHELVKFLRGHAVMNYEQEFGYSVMIRYTSECVAFQVIEARDLHAEFLIEKMEQPQRSNQKPELEKQESNDSEIRQRTGSFVVYFPKSAEDSNNGMRPGLAAANGGGPANRRGRHSAGSRSNENGSENSLGASGGPRGDPKYVYLVRGNEELMAWVSSWVQRRFQCVVGLHVVRVTEENLRRVARNWVIEALEREDKLERARVRKAERLRKISAASGEDMATKGHNGVPTSSPPRAPLLLKYRAKADSDVVKAFTMTMPWASVRRVHALMDGGVGSALGSVPEVIDRLEHLYFGNLKKDLASMTLMGFQMEEVEVDTQGKVKFFKSTMIHSILQSFLDIFVIQQVAGPTEPTTTF